ncbi:CBO0543 family protein [Bacillus salacetis]|uniref:CBO0543 family protein n=1 Tax=Bacillus salacetis TaxID=2315464 RepID=UPI003B9FDE18
MEKQKKMIDTLNEKQKAFTQDWMDYWTQYSALDTWQFWFLVVMFFLPLIILYFKLDRRKAFQLGFFGFNIHVWLGYIDRFGVNKGFWEYPYQWFMLLPSNVSLDASLIPVIYILLYQWILNNNKNFYLYMILLSAGLSFIFKPIIVLHFFLRFYIPMPYLYLFAGYLVIIFLSKAITDIFHHFQHEKTRHK